MQDSDDDAWLNDRCHLIGERIRDERMRQNLTQERLYLAAGISRWTLQDLEGGHGNPTLRTLLRVSRALNKPLSHLTDLPE